MSRCVPLAWLLDELVKAARISVELATNFLPVFEGCSEARQVPQFGTGGEFGCGLKMVGGGDRSSACCKTPRHLTEARRAGGDPDGRGEMCAARYASEAILLHVPCGVCWMEARRSVGGRAWDARAPDLAG